jgi:phosphoglycolate phosphatase
VKRLTTVLFDVDGVLLDSLPAHLQICRDKNKEYGLGLRIPTPAQFKRMARSRRHRISPMKYFFKAVGFKEKDAEKADRQYRRIFAKKYPPRPFPGMYRALRSLDRAGLGLGIVTSNVRTNVVSALGTSIRFFRPQFIFSKDSAAGSSKAKSIRAALKVLKAKPEETIYIGDQQADWEAAKATKVNFLGAGYGWAISATDKGFPVVRDISGIPAYILPRAARPRPPKT